MPSLLLALAETALLKLADFHLASTAVLAAALLTTGVLRQPAQRLAIAWASTAGIALLLVLATVPGWSIVHLRNPTPVVEKAVEPIGGDSLPPVNDPAFLMPQAPRHFDGVAAPAEPVTEVVTSAPTDWLALFNIALAVATLGGAAVTSAWLAWGATAARRIVARAEPAGVEAVRMLTELAAPSPTPRLLVSDRLATAVAIGLRRPAILLPRPMTAGAPGDLRVVLAHELAHIRGGDLWLLAGLRLAMIVLWPNPLYWALRRRARLDQETLADAAAAELAGRHDYAERLVSWARAIAAPPRLAGAAGIWEGQSQLRSRIAVLLDDRFTVLRRCSMRWRAATGLLCGALALAASLVSFSPAAPENKTATQSDTEQRVSDRQRGTAALSGKIVDEEGNPSKVAGWLYSGSESPGYSVSATQGSFTDRFECKVASGTVNLRFFPDEGYAPTVVGPFNLKDGDKLDDVVIKLSRGVSAPLLVLDEDDRPVGGATVVKHPRLNGSSNGPVHPQTTDSEGELLLERLAPNVLYRFSIEAPGYQPLRVEKVPIRRDGRPIQFTIKQARPTTGVVRLPDGVPCPGAKVKVLSEVESSGFTHDYPGGNELAMTDEEGRFTLDSLADGSHYLAIIEAPDSSRVLCVDLKAGKTDIEVDLPKRHDLLIRVRGDIHDLPKRNGEPYAKVQQRFDRQWASPAVNVSELFTAYVTLERTTGGAQAIFRGLVVDPRADAMGQSVEVVLGDGVDSGKTVSIDPDPDHMGLVQFNLASAGDESLDVMESSESVTYVPIGAPGEVYAPVADDQPPARLDFPASLPGESNVIAGLCLDAAGEPLAGVEVLLLHQNRKSNVVPIKRVGHATTGADGRFRFEGVVANPESVELKPMAPIGELYYVVTRREGHASRSLAQPLAEVARRGANVAFRLGPAATLAGRVTDSTGNPVEGARVSVAVNGSFDLGDQTMYAALTDADGRYAIRDLPQGDFAAQRRRQEQERLRATQAEGGLYSFVVVIGVATVTHPQYAIDKKPLESVPGELNFQLAPSAVVEGRLVHEKGKPLEGLGVQIQPDPLSPQSKEVAPFARSASVDAAGRYRFDSLPAGDYYLRVDGLYDSEFVSLSGQTAKAVVGEPATAADLVVSDGRVVRFQLVNAKTRDPLTFDEPVTGIAWYFLTGETPYGGSVTRGTEVNREGQFEYRIDNRAVRMMITLPLPTDDPQGRWPQFRVEVPTGDIGQPFLFPIDPEKVTSMKPQPVAALEAAGRLALEGKLDKAIDRLTQALKGQEPQDPQLLLRRADYLAQAKRHQEAIADYEAAIEQRPEFSFVLKNNLAYLLATVEDPQLRDAERAVQLAREATAEAPPVFAAQAYDTLATALEAAGDLQTAIGVLEKAVSVASDLQKPEFEEKLKKLRERPSKVVE